MDRKRSILRWTALLAWSMAFAWAVNYFVADWIANHIVWFIPVMAVYGLVSSLREHWRSQKQPPDSDPP